MTSHQHHHHHGDDSPEHPASARVRRLLLAATLPFVMLTLAGVVAFWPSGERTRTSLGIDFPSSFVHADVIAATPAPCPGDETDLSCRNIKLELRDGKEKGAQVEILDTALTRKLAPGDKVVLSVTPDAPPELRYDITDYDRRVPLLLLGILFAGVIVLLGRWRGALALAGLVASLFVLVGFVLPSILSGNPPLAVAITGSAVVMLVALYLAHGLNVRTTSAVLGTFVSLAIVALLSFVFVKATNLTGLGSEEALFVNVAAGRINLEGLLLAGIIIGSLGVLDDVTVTQASAVWELHLANPALGARELYQSAVRIGRDHIASTVNTLVLAYAGASLPLLILFTISNSHFVDVLNGEIVTEEVVRTLVGSIGLVASVPITTALAALVAASDRKAARPTPTRRPETPPRARPAEPAPGPDGARDVPPERVIEREYPAEPPPRPAQPKPVPRREPPPKPAPTRNPFPKAPEGGADEPRRGRRGHDGDEDDFWRRGR